MKSIIPSTVTMTRISKVTNLFVGDVLYIKEVGMYEANRKRGGTLPECNFHRLCVVSDLRVILEANPTRAEWVFDHRQHFCLSSHSGQHKIVESLLGKNLLLTNGSFGCNHRINDSYEVYRLVDIKNIDYHYNPPNLKGNPAYDLTM